ncbi:MAG TPA: hypothetical protein PLZ43_14950 [bacterium]|nr:hypothetical protein [bacterium]
MKYFIFLLRIGDYSFISTVALNSSVFSTSSSVHVKTTPAEVNSSFLKYPAINISFSKTSKECLPSEYFFSALKLGLSTL